MLRRLEAGLIRRLLALPHGLREIRGKESSCEGNTEKKSFRRGKKIKWISTISGALDSSMCPGVDSASKNEYQYIPGDKDGRCVRVTTLPPSCAECLEILGP
jgi:hypothetical protein